MSDNRLVRVLTVRQPWAGLIIHGGKDVENRSRSVIPGYRLLIHAGRTIDQSADGALAGIGLRLRPDWYQRAGRRTGFIIGMVDLIACVQDSPSKWAEPGAWHWVLANPVPVKHFIEVTGRQFLFHPPDNWEEAFK